MAAYFRCASCAQINRITTERGGTPVCGKCKQALDTSGKPHAIDDRGLRALERLTGVPVLVDFWAAWCGPCRIVGPILDQIGKERAGDLIVAKVDTDAQQDAAARYAIRSIPCLVLLRDGETIARLDGALPKNQLDRWLDQYLPSSHAA